MMGFLLVPGLLFKCRAWQKNNVRNLALSLSFMQEQRLAAVSYARTHLAPWAPQHMPELQRVLAALVFGRGTKLATYQSLFSEGRWASLLELFLRELYRLHALLPESALTVHLQVRHCDRLNMKQHLHERCVRVSDAGFFSRCLLPQCCSVVPSCPTPH
jgi:hypothetical protein